jgi:hypothetical protein
MMAVSRLSGHHSRVDIWATSEQGEIHRLQSSQDYLSAGIIKQSTVLFFFHDNNTFMVATNQPPAFTFNRIQRIVHFKQLLRITPYHTTLHISWRLSSARASSRTPSGWSLRNIRIKPPST